MFVLPENRPGNSASQKLEIINGYGMDFASIKDFWVNTYFYNASYSESSILMLVTYSVLSSSCYLSRWIQSQWLLGILWLLRDLWLIALPVNWLLG